MTPCRFSRRLTCARRGRVCAVACVAAAMFATAAAAHAQSNHRPYVKATRAEHPNAKEPFGTIPKGPLQIIISIDQQKLHLYSDSVHVADSPVATGVLNHPTPLGIFDVIQKSRLHLSNIYSNAPMPFMQRITWSGVALHEGVGAGHRASHGCIRVPHEFAVQLWALTKLGAEVVIADPELHPQEFTDPHLFVHKAQPAAPAAAAAAATEPKLPVTAQSSDGATTTDAVHQTSKDAVDPPADAASDPRPGAAIELPAPAADPPAPAEDQPAPAKQQSAALAPADVKPAALPAISTEILRKVSKAPVAIFISRKEKKIFVRQDFAPLFDAPVTIERPEQRIGSHIFTALGYLGDGSTLRWNVVSMPDEPRPPARAAAHERKYANAVQRDERIVKPSPLPPPQTPQEALARIEIPQAVMDQISQLIVPGSSLIVSDQGLGEETGEGTNFIVVTR